MIEFILVGFILLIFLFAYTQGKDLTPRDPRVVSSRGDYESHLDFLEAHGCIDPHEREESRRIQQEYKDHPERFRVVTLEELIKEQRRD